LIWKAFMEKAIALKHFTPESFPYPPSQYAAPVYVVNRGGLLMRDNGACKNSYQLAFYGGVGPSHVATCKPNEVVVPKVVGEPLARAQEKLAHLALDVEVKGPSDGRVVKQSLDPGTAAAPGLRLTLSAEP